MCFNLEVSVATFVVSIVCCLALFVRDNVNDRFIALYCGFVAFMQLLEALMWLDQQCTGLNEWATRVAKWHNALQPVVGTMIAYAFATPNEAKQPTMLTILLTFAIYAYTALPTILKNYIVCSRPCGGNSGGLKWSYTGGREWFLFFVACNVPLLAIRDGRRFAYIGMSSAATFVGAILAHMRCPRGESNLTAGSIWCLLVNTIPIAALFVNRTPDKSFAAP